MNKLAKISLASLLMLSSATIALAQDSGTGVGVGVDAGVSAGTTVDGAGAAVGVDANADANVNASGSMASNDRYGSLMSSMKAHANTDLSAVTDDVTVSFVLVSSLKGEADANAEVLDKALSADADGQTKLHTDIAANAALMAKLEAAGYSAEDVVAVSAQADNALIVYIDDRA